MGRRLKLDYVQQQFALEGYILLSKHYKSNQQKLEYQCPSGHTGSITFASFSQGGRCLDCHRLSRFKTIYEVAEYLKKEGYQLASKSYGGCRERLEMICPVGHSCLITWHGFRFLGRRCLECKETNKKSLKEVETVCKERGYKLLMPDPGKYDFLEEGQAQILTLACSKGHISSKSWAEFRHGRGCRECAIARAGESRRLSLDFVRNAFLQRGYELLSPEYKNKKQSLNFRCSKGHISSIQWKSFSRGGGCAQCGFEARRIDLERASSKAIGLAMQTSLNYCLRSITQGKSHRVESFWRSLAKSMIETMGTVPEGHEIDHICPRSFFDLTREEEVKACWSICNLRYITEAENQKRSNHLTLEEVQTFTYEQLKILDSASFKPYEWQLYLEQTGIIFE